MTFTLGIFNGQAVLLQEDGKPLMYLKAENTAVTRTLDLVALHKALDAADREKGTK